MRYAAKKESGIAKAIKTFPYVRSLEVYMHHALRRTNSEHNAAVGTLRFLIENEGRTKFTLDNIIKGKTRQASRKQHIISYVNHVTCGTFSSGMFCFSRIFDTRIRKKPECIRSTETRMHSEYRTFSFSVVLSLRRKR